MAQFWKAAELGAGGRLTLEGRFYSSPEVFAEEQDRLFLRHWICVAREEELPSAGDFVQRMIDTESVVIIRGTDAKVRAFHNVCRHRGTRLCEEEFGQFANAIRCPYHAWTYGLDGRLLAASSMGGVDGFDREAHGLLPVGLALWEGFVFVSLGSDPQAFESSHAALHGRFTRYDIPALRCLRSIRYDVRANWKLIFENYSECYHCPSVHPGLVKLSPANSGGNDLTSGPFLGGYMDVRDGFESMTLSGKACGAAVGELPEADKRRIYYYSIFPNMLLSLHPDYVMVHTLWPNSPHTTRIDCAWLFHPSSSDDPGFDPDDAVAFWDRTNREDWHICERSHLGVVSRAYRPGPYSPREGISAAFDAEYLQAMGLEAERIGGSVPG